MNLLTTFGFGVLRFLVAGALWASLGVMLYGVLTGSLVAAPAAVVTMTLGIIHVSLRFSPTARSLSAVTAPAAPDEEPQRLAS